MIKRLQEIFADLRQLLTPRQSFSWQTLAWLSVFSYLMALLAPSRLVKEFLAGCGWIFLIVTVGWATLEYPIKVFKFNLGPWITGALLSTFLFGNFTEWLPSLPYVAWPVLSAGVASLPNFLNGDLKFTTPKTPDRQFIVILVLSNLVLSCWIQFYFAIQYWAEQYPSLMTDDLKRSAFVIRFDLRPTPSSRGDFILAQAEQVLRDQVDNRPWPQAERWLFEVRQNPGIFSKAVMEQVQRTEQEATVQQRAVRVAEDFLWRVESSIREGNPYNMDVIARWQGPSFNARGYYVQRSCRITRGAPPARPESTMATDPSLDLVGKVACGGTSDRLVDGVAPPTQ